MNAHVLVVDDEQKLASILARYLELAGYRVSVLFEGTAVLRTLLREQIDVVLLDWMLPGVDGLTLCQQMRASSDIPIIMMTSRAEESDRIAGLDTGADDYICKPISMRETVARVRALLRRRPPNPVKNPRRVCIDDVAHRIVVNSKDPDLTVVEYRLMKALYSTPERTFTRDELLDNIYEDHRVVSDRTIDVHVKNLRHKLQACGLENVITTVYGIGYRWQ